jgi:hypothetical protein
MLIFDDATSVAAGRGDDRPLEESTLPETTTEQIVASRENDGVRSGLRKMASRSVG